LHTNEADDSRLRAVPLPTDPLLLDAHEAARLLNVSERTLWQLEKDKKIKAKRIGRRVLYARSVLEEFARS
jgi:excisionase family DNA binding protein